MQKPNPVALVVAVAGSVSIRAQISGAERTVLGRFETEARANFNEALFLIAGQLNEAAAALQEAPLP